MPSVATAKKPPSKSSGQKVAHARAAEPVLVKGRRDFFKYRDFEVPAPAPASPRPGHASTRA